MATALSGNKSFQNISFYHWAGLCVLLIAIAIRLYFLPLIGHEGDLNCFANWTKAVTEHGIP